MHRPLEIIRAIREIRGELLPHPSHPSFCTGGGHIFHRDLCVGEFSR
jgi:hypothetical protein